MSESRYVPRWVAVVAVLCALAAVAVTTAVLLSVVGQRPTDGPTLFVRDGRPVAVVGGAS